MKPNGTLVTIADNLVGVQKHYLEASGKLYDPTVPDDGPSAGDGIGYSEFAGPTFSPDGQWLFVNIQVPGITCAITGDWSFPGSVTSHWRGGEAVSIRTALQPLSQQSTPELIADQLRVKILDGTFPPHHQLAEAELGQATAG